MKIDGRDSSKRVELCFSSDIISVEIRSEKSVKRLGSASVEVLTLFVQATLPGRLSLFSLSLSDTTQPAERELH